MCILQLHIVHYAEKYGDIGSSLGHSDGLAVLGFFFVVSKLGNVIIFLHKIAFRSNPVLLIYILH